MAPMAMMAQGEGRMQDKDPKAMAEARTARMTEKLSLSPDQVEKVSEINYRHAEKMVAIKQEQDMETKKSAMKELREWRQGELKAVLTAEQIARMEEMKKQRKEKYDSKRKGEHRKGAVKDPAAR